MLAADYVYRSIYGPNYTQWQESLTIPLVVITRLAFPPKQMTRLRCIRVRLALGSAARLTQVLQLGMSTSLLGTAALATQLSWHEKPDPSLSMFSCCSWFASSWTARKRPSLSFPLTPTRGLGPIESHWSCSGPNSWSRTMFDRGELEILTVRTNSSRRRAGVQMPSQPRRILNPQVSSHHSLALKRAINRSQYSSSVQFLSSPSHSTKQSL